MEKGKEKEETNNSSSTTSDEMKSLSSSPPAAKRIKTKPIEKSVVVENKDKDNTSINNETQSNINNDDDKKENKLKEQPLKLKNNSNSNTTSIPTENNETDDMNNNDEKVKMATFVLRSPVTEKEVKKVETKILSDLSKASTILDTHRSKTQKNEEGIYMIEKTNIPQCATSLIQSNIFTFSNNNTNANGGVGGYLNSIGDENKRLEDIAKEAEMIEKSVINGTPRKYQMALYEKAKNINTIVNLGTGMGKTLIALLCIKHFAIPSYEEGKQTLFLVPSIALAVQQTYTLRANLPYKVATACHSSSSSDQAKKELRDADIIVATHGAAEDLFRHYVDVMSMSRINLLVLDECHYATGNHGYARIMEMFYHVTPRNKRPRVLGLTASPLVNVRPNVGTDLLQKMLKNLEFKLDSELACFNYQDTSLGMEMKTAEERLVQYDNGPPDDPLPSNENIGLHTSRIKELKQLVNLYEDFGPKVTGIYCNTLKNEISCNRFEKETITQFEIMKKQLGDIANFCENVYENKPELACSDKLMVLEQLLDDILSVDGSNEIVGVIFVERRITALALHGYLRSKWRIIRSTREENENNNIINDDDDRPIIKCDMIVRQSTQVFKYLHPSHHIETIGDTSITDDWLHKTKRVRDVLDGLRRRETNVLIATSVVEEGVDVDACSFVIVLDSIKTTKAYIQMKGRARKKNAKFFVFENVHPFSNFPSLSLRNAQDVERRVNKFIMLRDSNIPDSFEEDKSKIYVGESTNVEEKALIEREYRSKNACVDLKSAKSLLNRYSLSIPMDTVSRSSRQALLLHMPIYDGYRLTLPAHLPSDVRSVSLPEQFRSSKTKKNEIQNMLALMACVRLHKLNLLSDRLLPLKRTDMQTRLLSVALRKLPTVVACETKEEPPSAIESSKMFHLYKVNQSGALFDQHRDALKHSNESLGLITFSPLMDIPPFKFRHTELSHIDVEIEKLSSDVVITKEEWDLCAKFYTILMDARWRRKTGKYLFRFNFDKATPAIFKHYVVVCLTSNKIDWKRMLNVLTDHDLNDDQRKKKAMANAEGLESKPRLWQPVYDPNVTYIAFGPSGIKAKHPFPYSEKYTDYVDYMSKNRGYKIEPECPLIVVQRLWMLPRRMRQYDTDHLEIINKKRLAEEMDDIFGSKGDSFQQVEGERSPCEGLDTALLPLDICLEANVADANLFLLTLIFPQILYHIDRILTVMAFIEHCKLNVKALGDYLEKLPLPEVLEALTARSCSMDMSYDRLEYLGDAVLKMIHTDALLHSKDLWYWVGFLHEGDLNALRSAMGSNERLKDSAVSLGFDKYILTIPLGRGQWVPSCIEMYLKEEYVDENKKSRDMFKPSNKVCADMIESLLGIVYLHFGYLASMEVAEQLGVSLPAKLDSEYESGVANVTVSKSDEERLKKVTTTLMGKSQFNRTDVLLEAVTHPSCVHEEVPCYQRLEWVGDAVLCLAAREWVYLQYPQLKVAELAVIETTLVCNETLAYLGSSLGIHRHINHRDPSLPHRFSDFEKSIQEGRGLWGTDPPKVISDVVEALLGAAFTDSGFQVGQDCAIFLINPVVLAVKKQLQGESYEQIKAKAREMMHPKQVVHEIAGRYLQARSMREDEFALRFPDCPVWRGYRWDIPKTQNTGAIGQVLCCGLNVIAVAEASAHIAKNRACGLAVAIFHRCPDSLVKVQEISKVLNKSDLSKKEEKEEEVQHEEQEQNSNSTISAITTSNTTTNEESLKKTDVNK